MTKLDANHLNGKYSNGKYEDTIKEDESQILTAESKTPKSLVTKSSASKFEQSVVLRQSPVWSRSIMLTMMGLACFGITWAYFAKIEQVIP
ncbi:MAG: hemolysin D, partial [Tolypothrix sp. Co-bin9]|nr:hemolysin D [Tolypothrix sp. Co-bin9]